MTTEPQESREEIEEAAATWIARRDGKWTPSDAALFDAWLAESAGHRVAYYRLNAAWDQAGQLEVPSSYRNLYLAAAAAVIVVVAGAVVSVQMGLFRPTPTTPAPTVVQANDIPAGEVEKEAASPVPQEAIAPAAQSIFRQRYGTAVGASRVISLPDGSRLTLDTDSQVEVTIDGKARTVRLQRGQAFFEVAHDRQRPFVVDTDRLSVTAVGTAFSVRWVGLDIRVDVAEGTVRLGRPGEREDLLPAGGIARVEGEAVQIQLGQSAEVDRNLSWRSGVLTFRHTSLADAVAEFNRYGTRQIVIRDAQIAALELGGVFKSGDAEVFARLLERTFPIDAAINPDSIELSARRSP
jgi:transmembrane sensor